MLLLLFLLRCAFAVGHSNLYREIQCAESGQNLKLAVERLTEELAAQSDCIVFITDTVYRRLIDVSKIKLPDGLSRYGVAVRDNENFSRPRRRLRAILASSKSAGCGAYVILIANGFVAARFLQYTEQERLIDTRGAFLLLYDERLFTPKFRYIWNRIINVIFVRRYSSYTRRSGETVAGEPVDLYTVYFPSRKKRSIGSKYINRWRNGRFRYGVTNFKQNTANLLNKPLRIAIFEHIPAVTNASRSYYKSGPSYSTKALGVEFELMRVISKAMHFKPIYYSPYDIDTERWGIRGPNGTYSGLLGEAIDRKASFYLGDLHYTSFHLNFLDLSIPYNTECLTFLTPESLTDNSWKLLLLPFKLSTWIPLLLLLVLGGAALYLFSLFYKKNVSFYTGSIQTPGIQRANDVSQRGIVGMRGLHLFTEAQSSFLYTYSMLLLVSLPRLPEPWAVRVFIGWWWIYSILVAVAYRASMTATLANPVAKVTIDTLDQLARTPIGVGGWSEESKDFFLMSPEPCSQIIASKFERTNGEEGSIERVANGTFAYYENSYLLMHERVKWQVLEHEKRENGSESRGESAETHSLHIMNECVINMPIALGLEKNSPLKPQVDKLVRRIMEAGLVEKWLSDVMEWSKITEVRQETEVETALVNLRKLNCALVAIGIGYFVSLVALIGEILHWRYVVLRDPRYDKYHLDMYYGATGKGKV